MIAYGESDLESTQRKRPLRTLLRLPGGRALIPWRQAAMATEMLGWVSFGFAAYGQERQAMLDFLTVCSGGR